MRRRFLIERWREDPRSTYQTWFLWEERLKNFRSIPRGLAAVVAETEAGTLPLPMSNIRPSTARPRSGASVAR